MTRGWPSGNVAHLSGRTASRLGPRVARTFDVVFDAATGLGNVRRLQVIRLLMQRGPVAPTDIQRVLEMSAQACTRHLEKLHDRGYVRQAENGAWALARQGRTAFHEALYRLAGDALIPPSRSYITPG